MIISRELAENKAFFKPLQEPEIIFKSNAITKDFVSTLYIQTEGLYSIKITGEAIDLDKIFDGMTIQFTRNKKPKSALDKALRELDDRLKATKSQTA